MRNRLLALVGCALAMAWQTMFAAAPAQPVKLSSADTAKVLKEIEQDRIDTQKWLQSDPTSYLRLGSAFRPQAPIAATAGQFGMADLLRFAGAV